VDGVTIVEFQDAKFLIQDHEVRVLGDRLRGLVSEGHVRILIHPEGVEYASSCLLATMAWLHRRVFEAHGYLRLYGLTPIFRDILRCCSLDRILEIYETEAEALAAGDRASALVRSAHS
jgi:anti-anti-sigma factor